MTDIWRDGAEMVFEKEESSRMLVTQGELLDRKYACVICNEVFLYRLDAEEHELLKGHSDILVHWLDDIIRMDDFFH